jgi:hypothetical protein
MRFSYLPQRVRATPAAPEIEILYRPVIPVRFHGPKGATKVRALLDTGADETYITAAIAAELGVTPVSDHQGTIHSASGKMSVWYGRVVIGVSDLVESYSFPLIVGVVTEDWDEIILGHIGFFEHFDAHFSDVDRIVTLMARDVSGPAGG